MDTPIGLFLRFTVEILSLCLNLYGSERRYDTYGHFKLKASAVRKKKSRPPAVKAPVCEG